MCPPNQKPCVFRVAEPAHVAIRDDETERIFSAAGVDVQFVDSDKESDYVLQYADLSARKDLGYAGAGPNLVQLDYPAINRQGRAAGAASVSIETAIGMILAHELGHKFLGAGHSPGNDIMRNGVDIGNSIFKGIDFSGALYFSPAQAAIIRQKCRALRQSHPLKR